MADIKAYRPRSSSLSSGQVLHCPYSFSRARLVLREMADALSMDLTARDLTTDQLVLTVGYDAENLKDSRRRQSCCGPVTTDHCGRSVPRHAHGTANLGRHTSSSRLILQAATELFDRITDPALLIRRITLTAGHVVTEDSSSKEPLFEQLDLFTDYQAAERQRAEEDARLNREKSWQKALLDIRKKYGKNAVLRGMSLQDGATARDRNQQIGGHRA